MKDPVRSVPGEHSDSAMQNIGMLFNRKLLAGALVTVLAYAGSFTAYTFIAPILTQVTGVNGKQKPYYSVSSLGARWNAAVKRAGIRRRNPYHTRHTFACWLLTAGANPAFIASQMGHETAQMVYEIYGMWIDDMNDEQIAMLNARLS